MIIKKKIKSCGELMDTCWSGAINTIRVLDENDKIEEFVLLMEELYPDGLTETELNDILWFDDEWIFDTLGINTQEDEEE